MNRIQRRLIWAVTLTMLATAPFTPALAHPKPGKSDKDFILGRPLEAAERSKAAAGGGGGPGFASGGGGPRLSPTSRQAIGKSTSPATTGTGGGP